MVRTKQGGSILSFVVLGGVLALLLIGGVYLVRHTLSPAMKVPQVAVSDHKDEQTDSSQNNQDDTEDAPEQNSGASDQTNGSDQSTPSEVSNNDSGDSTPAAPSPAVTDNDLGSNGLPTTGPSDGLFAGIMVSGVVALAIAYIKSRHSLSSL